MDQTKLEGMKALAERRDISALRNWKPQIILRWRERNIFNSHSLQRRSDLVTDRYLKSEVRSVEDELFHAWFYFLIISWSTPVITGQYSATQQ